MSLIFHQLKMKANIRFQKLESITNLNHKVEVDDKKYIIRIPGENPDLINRSSEGINQELVENIGITLPIILFEKDTGIKISEFYEDLYTFTSSDLKNKEFRDDALIEISKKAISKKTGARGLRSILESLLLKTMFSLPDMENVESVTVDKSVVKGKSEPIITYSKAKSTSVA